jgi:hypothetical protein
MTHDLALFEKLFALAATIDPEVRKGNMYGCPAIYKGRKLAACVYGASVGMKVPECVASGAIQKGTATHFQPYGKGKMREWIQLDVGADIVFAQGDLLATAIRYAESNNA